MLDNCAIELLPKFLIMFLGEFMNRGGLRSQLFWAQAEYS